MEQGRGASEYSIEVCFKVFYILVVLKYNNCCRRAKTKLPGEVKKKVEDWKFSTGALVMCLVAYPDGKDVQSFQFVHLSFSMTSLLSDFQCGEYPCCWE